MRRATSAVTIPYKHVSMSHETEFFECSLSALYIISSATVKDLVAVFLPKEYSRDTSRTA
jgi:hypothetical protein